MRSPVADLLADVAMLLRVQAGQIDHPRVRQVLTMLEGALGQSDLVREFDRLRAASG